MKQAQNGSVLAISLVLLTAITLLSMMGLQRSGLQTKIVANIQHKEAAYNTDLSEQQAQLSAYTKSADPDEASPDTSQLLFDIINKFTVSSGVKTQETTDLPAILDPVHLQLASTIRYLLPIEGSETINLSVGHEVDMYANHYFQLDSTASSNNASSIASSQRTGFHFSALIVGKASL
jgi:hypothetical protein